MVRMSELWGMGIAISEITLSSEVTKDCARRFFIKLTEWIERIMYTFFGIL